MSSDPITIGQSLTLKVLQDTFFKAAPADSSTLNDQQEVWVKAGQTFNVDSAQLQTAERANFNAGNFYGVSSYAIQGGHIKVALTEELPSFGNTEFVFPSFVQMKRGGRPFNPIPPTVEINVPYFSQRDNPGYYWATCNVTSIAMVFYYYGIRAKNSGQQLEDELLQWYLNKGRTGSQTNHNVLSQLIQAYGFKPSFDVNRTWQEVKEELINQ